MVGNENLNLNLFDCKRKKAQIILLKFCLFNSVVAVIAAAKDSRKLFEKAIKLMLQLEHSVVQKFNFYFVLSHKFVVLTVI